MLVSKAIQQAQRKFQDEAGTLIKLPEWLDDVREFLLDYSSRTEQFRARTRLDRGQNPWLFRLPENTISVLWASWDDETLELTTYKQLERQDRRFLSRTGTPRMAFRDLSNVNELRLWPAPAREALDLTQATFVEADWNGTDDPADGDAGGLTVFALSGNTYRSTKMASGRGGLIEIDPADERGEIVSIIRTDSPESQAGGRAFDTAAQFGEEAGGPVQVRFSRVEIGYSYTPTLPDDDNEALASEIPLADYNEMACLYFLLWRAYEKSIETGDDKKAERYRLLYEQRVELGIRKKSDSWAARTRRVRGGFI